MVYSVSKGGIRSSVAWGNMIETAGLVRKGRGREFGSHMELAGERGAAI